MARFRRLLWVGIVAGLAAFAAPSAHAGGTQQFIRGDINLDGLWDIADPVALLNWLFVPGMGTPPPCADSADANDDGAVETSDAIYLLNFLFVPGAPPFPEPLTCGVDPTPDGLDCAMYTACGPGGGVDFGQFVIDLFAATSDETDPEPVNGLDFIFDDDPAIFATLLP